MSTRTDVSVVVADDDEHFLRALTSVFADEPGFEVTGSATTAIDLLALVVVRRPDVVVCDVRMPGGGIAVVAGEIRAWCPMTVIVALTAHPVLGPMPSLVRAGAIGPLAKGLPVADLLTVILAALADRRPLP